MEIIHLAHDPENSSFWDRFSTNCSLGTFANIWMQMEKCAINTEFAARINDVRVIWKKWLQIHMNPNPYRSFGFMVVKTLWRKVSGVYKEAFD